MSHPHDSQVDQKLDESNSPLVVEMMIDDLEDALSDSSSFDGQSQSSESSDRDESDLSVDDIDLNLANSKPGLN